jgi:hypothetical protein
MQARYTHYISKPLLFAVGLVSVTTTVVAQTRDDSFKTSISVGVDRSTGKFGGTEKTDITYVPTTLKLENNDMTLKLSVPYINISGPSNVVGGAGNAPIVTSNSQNATRRTASGLGDVVASAGFNVGRNVEGGYGVDLVTKVKFPTADEKQGLGTGKRDYSVQFDGFSISGKTTYFGTMGYKKMGDTSTIDFRDTAFGAFGVARALNRKSQMGIIYDHRQASVSGVASQKEITLFITNQLAKELRLQAYLVGGLTNSSVDSAFGLQLSQSLD